MVHLEIIYRIEMKNSLHIFFNYFLFLFFLFKTSLNLFPIFNIFNFFIALKYSLFIFWKFGFMLFLGDWEPWKMNGNLKYSLFVNC